MSIEQERADAQARIDAALQEVRLNTAILRDTMMTADEHEAKMQAAFEWLEAS